MSPARYRTASSRYPYSTAASAVANQRTRARSANGSTISPSGNRPRVMFVGPDPSMTFTPSAPAEMTTIHQEYISWKRSPGFGLANASAVARWRSAQLVTGHLRTEFAVRGVAISDAVYLAVQVDADTGPGASVNFPHGAGEPAPALPGLGP